MLLQQCGAGFLLFYLVCILCSCKVKSLPDDIEANGLLVSFFFLFWGRVLNPADQPNAAATV